MSVFRFRVWSCSNAAWKVWILIHFSYGSWHFLNMLFIKPIAQIPTNDYVSSLLKFNRGLTSNVQKFCSHLLLEYEKKKKIYTSPIKPVSYKFLVNNLYQIFFCHSKFPIKKIRRLIGGFLGYGFDRENSSGFDREKLRKKRGFFLPLDRRMTKLVGCF